MCWGPAIVGFGLEIIFAGYDDLGPVLDFWPGYFGVFASAIRLEAVGLTSTMVCLYGTSEKGGGGWEDIPVSGRKTLIFYGRHHFCRVGVRRKASYGHPRRNFLGKCKTNKKTLGIE